jgi:hypothetical protein
MKAVEKDTSSSHSGLDIPAASKKSSLSNALYVLDDVYICILNISMPISNMDNLRSGLWNRKTPRPSIYERPNTALVKHFKPVLTADEFGRFFRDYLELVKPHHNPNGELDICDLRDIYAVIPARRALFSKVQGFRGQCLLHSLPAMLVAREIIRIVVEDSDKATDLVVSMLPNLGESIVFWLFDPKRLQDVCMEMDNILRDIPKKETCGGVKGIICEEVTRFQNNCRNDSTEIDTDYFIDGRVLDSFAISVINSVSPLYPFEYPISMCDLRAVFGQGPHDSYIVEHELKNSYVPIAQPHITYHVEPNLSANHTAVISMYPWEADRVEKAREMLSRGVPISKPLGNLRINSMDFGLFQWVPGTPLDMVQDPAVWESYGKVVRYCHEHGIALDDAAGRNAIWSGSNVVLIDFEHTWLKEKGSICKKDRSTSISRLKQELKGKKYLFSAFNNGYESG